MTGDETRVPDGLKGILRLAQGDLPLSEAPFAAWAGEAGTSEEALISGISALKESGVIRRFGGVFDSRKMGLYTTLVGAVVALERLEAALARICAWDGATHVYVRDHEVNVWFTLAAETGQAADDAVKSLEKDGLALAAWSMPMKKRFKLEVRFDP